MTGLTADMLRKMVKEMRDKDPLLSRGIELDWVCVVNPAIVSHIHETAKGFRKPDSPVMPVDDLQLVMGRRVFIINDASINPEYMTEETMRLKYAEHFMRELEYMAEQAKKENGDES